MNKETSLVDTEEEKEKERKKQEGKEEWKKIWKGGGPARQKLGTLT